MLLGGMGKTRPESEQEDDMLQCQTETAMDYGRRRMPHQCTRKATVTVKLHGVVKLLACSQHSHPFTSTWHQRVGWHTEASHA